jgi:hypothetical protein
MPTDWTSGLLPQSVSDSVLSAAEEESAVLSLAQTRRMGTATEWVPLVSVAPRAAWIDTGERKPYSAIEWSAERLTARELAVTTYVEDAYIDDASWNVEASVEHELGAAIARALDAAVLFGTDAPPGFPAGGIATAPVTGPDALAAIDAALTAVEATGVIPNGVVAGPAIGSALRQAYLAQGSLPSDAPSNQLFGIPSRVTPVWDPTKGDAIVGDFDLLVVGVRQDIEIETSRDGVLQDAAGEIIANAFEQDLTLVRAHSRFAVAVGKPVQPDGSGAVVPFATADWTP